ncbi:GlcG/HbpS family heme-binding protein [Faecalispora anaeroviscerum]|uniref:GlcG/HbpS family heme-binding protein n=1 Tax=Faecalispora anaeroviscerum TaxID=2991836 RepID=UPI0024B98D38|nr:heme-binding protein [Faecalispora anaeroviscerum]
MLHEELKEEIMRQLAEYGERGIDLDLAEQMIKVAREKAKEVGVPVSAAVVDAGGNLILHLRMDGAVLISVDAAYSKAYTSASLELPTGSLHERTIPEGKLYGLHTMFGGRYCVFGGGLPLFRAGRLVGAVGISGGTVEEDTTIAEAAVSACQELSWSKNR